jgi:spermidine synthase
VLRESNNVTLWINGKVDASLSPEDLSTQVLLGHLPLLLHQDPRAALVIGLGSGITAGSVARHPVERLDIVEIEPAVVEASRFFASQHGDVLRDPRVRVVIADGRNFLLATGDRYDVIAAEPSNPWLSGVATLFTVEFFELARRHLRPGGIMLQWVQGYNLDPRDLRMVVNTFRTVFPATSIWEGASRDFLLLGRTEPLPVDTNAIEMRVRTNPGVEQDLLTIGISGWIGLLGHFVLSERDTARYADGAALNTDDRLRLEFAAPHALHIDAFGPSLALMRKFRISERPDTTPESRSP